MGTHQKRLTEALLMSIHNMCIPGDMIKILCRYTLLSGAMKLSAAQALEVLLYCSDIKFRYVFFLI